MGEQPSNAFELLDPRVKRWVWQQGWETLRAVQEAAIPAVLQGSSDVLLCSATASGKTEAAFLPLLSRVLTTEAAGFRALYIGPLKALINDQFRRLEPLCEALGIDVHRWHGDVADSTKRAAMAKASGVILITPESLESLFIRHGRALAGKFSGLAGVVIDELHAYIGSERGAQLQSLLNRLELLVGQRAPRIGLSATLGRPELAAEFLRPREAATVTIVDLPTATELLLEVRGYQRRPPVNPDSETRPGEADNALDDGEAAIAEHLFKVLGVEKNLVFANSRRNVEKYTDSLQTMADHAGRPRSFFAHHGNLSKELREEAETALRDNNRAVSIVSTTTLELGIDIGDVDSIAQIGCPPSVASLRQRLGRSGRRTGSPKLRGYVVETALDDKTPLLGRLRLGLFQMVAMVELMLERWVEPPEVAGIHLSTLVQQSLSFVAERGGAPATALYDALCRQGPFSSVSPSDFARLLKELGLHEVLSQADDGTLLPGRRGERMIEHYKFYAAFNTPDELRLECRGRLLGTLSTEQPLSIGGFLIFGGRRWRIEVVNASQKVVEVSPAASGRVPTFDAAVGGAVHDEVRRRMKALYGRAVAPEWLNTGAATLWNEGQAAFKAQRLDADPIIDQGGECAVFHWSGDRVGNTLAFEFLRRDLHATPVGPALIVEGASIDRVRSTLEEVARDVPSEPSVLLDQVRQLEREKWDYLVPRDLLLRDFALRTTDGTGAKRVATALLGAQTRP